MGQALYRKYRSRTFSEVVGQEPITETLKKAIKSGRLSHAYLFSGPRGTGKTSVARIIAHEVNNLPYKGESFHLDIIEVDAASNRRIDEIRDIREKVHITPTSGKYKVYIIDEAHMLTKEAFNALLKTLEEPPAHCIFILATTEAHKLPQTIISRTQRFNFKPVQKDKVVSHLAHIAKIEKIDIVPEALEMLADQGEGSFRDSISFLDQLSSQRSKITVAKTRELLGLPSEGEIAKLITLIQSGNPKAALGLLDKLRLDGANVPQITSELNKQLRAQILDTRQPGDVATTSFLKNLLEVEAANQPFELLEILVLETALSNRPLSPDKELAPKLETPPIDAEFSGAPTDPKPPKAVSRTNKFSLVLWPEVLTLIKQRAASVYTALRLAEPKLNGDRLLLQFQFPLHKNKLGQSHHIDLIGDIIQELSGTKVQIQSVLAPRKTKKVTSPDSRPAKKRHKDADELTTISNIFGSAEVLES